MNTHEKFSTFKAVQAVLQDAHDSQLIQPTFVENLAIKKCVNVANTVLETVRIADKVCTRDIMSEMNMSEATSRNYLIILHELGYLNKTREGKGFIYSYNYLPEHF